MNKNIIIGIVIVLALVGGYAIFKDSNKEVLVTPTPVPDPLPLSPDPKSPAPIPSVKEFTITGSNFAFAPSTMTVKKGDTVKITFKNSGGMHDWRIDEFNAATKVIASGAEETITFVANKTGSFEYYCSVGTHRQMGMKGTLTVTE